MQIKAILQRISADCPLHRRPQGVGGGLGLPLVALPQNRKCQREEQLPGGPGLHTGGLAPREVPRHGAK